MMHLSNFPGMRGTPLIDAGSARRVTLATYCLAALVLQTAAQDSPSSDTRAGTPKTLDTPRTFPIINSRAEWTARAKEIREHVLVSCGLWPMPEKAALNAGIRGRVERDGYSIEKVHFQTYPGFYLAGNLYRPLGKGNGPFPGVLNPHGHWKDGRMADTPDGSIAARCINFARQGMVALSYDMVGYNDTKQINHKFASAPTNLLWNISLMGLQTWNSIRALDFLSSLADVDKARLACTGESGGGTQTFMLGAVEERLAAQGPIVMVSHTMQGGCLCENAPGLRVDYYNVEIAAVPAPRPQILVAATGDWTKATMTVEGPAMAGVYKLFGAEDKFRSVLFDFGHNYNQTSREAVYAWFGRWLLGKPDQLSLPESAYVKEPTPELLVWPEGKLPEDALGEDAFIPSLIRLGQSQLASLKPRDRPSLEKFKQIMRPAWRHTLQVELPERGVAVEVGSSKQAADYSTTKLWLSRKGRGDRVPVLQLAPKKDTMTTMVVLAHPEGKAAYLDADGTPRGLARRLLDRNQSVLLVDTFLTGELADPAAEKARNHFSHFFCTYNRTDTQERVQDLITAATFARTHGKDRRVTLCGAGRAGLWALLAAPAADAVVADCVGLDAGDDQALLAQDLFVPGIRRIGAFEGAAALAAPHPLLVHNTGEKFSTDWLRETYAAANAAKDFRVDKNPAGDDQALDWILRSSARR